MSVKDKYKKKPVEKKDKGSVGSMPNKPKEVQRKQYYCLRCGKHWTVQQGNFYKNTQSILFYSNNGFTPYCVECVNTMLADYTEKYGYFNALQIICHYLDMPYIHDIAKTMISNETTTSFGSYSKIVGSKAYTNITFADTIMTHSQYNFILDAPNIVSDMSSWSIADKKKADSVISRCGHDPFMSTTDEKARKQMFNIMYEYLVDDSIVSDIHKRNAVVNIVIANYQISEIDKKINALYAKNTKESQTVGVDKLVKMKSDLLSVVDRIAKENGISSGSNKSKSSENALSAKLKELREIGMDAEEVNLYDIKTSRGMSQVAELSVANVIRQLQLTENEMLEMIADQTKIMDTLQKENDQLKEEKRLMLVEKTGVPKGKIPVEIFVDSKDKEAGENDSNG